MMMVELVNQEKGVFSEMLNLDQIVPEPTHATPSIKRQSGDRGFSVLELVIVVGVVAIICAFALPNATRSVDLRRLDGTGSLLASKLADARMNAIKRNRQAWVLVDPVARTMQVQSTDNGGATINLGPATTLADGIAISSPTAAAQVRFDSLGRLPAGTPAWTITFSGVQNTKTKSVGISVAGRVSVANMASVQQAY